MSKSYNVKKPSQHRTMYVRAMVQTEDIRTAELQGRSHIVLPVVALVEGVLHPSNAESPELALASEFGHFPDGWNGRPVVLNHPKVDGEPVSANSPRIMNNEVFGQLFNTVLDDTKLKSEIWIDTNRANELGGKVQDAVDRLQDGELMEVSTGLFMDLDPTEGTYNGARFSGIWRNIVPDHLAVLPPGTIGACSIADGCGAPRTNAERKKRMAEIRGAQGRCNTGNGKCQMMGNSVCECTDCLMGNNDALKYPENNLFGGSEDQQEDAGISGNSGVVPTSVARSLQSAAAAVGKALRFATQKRPSGEVPSVQQIELTPAKDGCDCHPKPGALAALSERFGPLIGLVVLKGRGGLSDVDTRAALQSAMKANKMSGYIVATYDDFFVYEDYMSGDVFQVGYSISPSGQVTLKDGAVAVRPVTTFVPTNNSQEGDIVMAASKAKVDGLIANSSGQFTETDRAWLTAMNDDQIDKFVKMGVEAAKSERDNARSETQTEIEKAVQAALKANAKETPKTVEEFIAAAPPEVGTMLAEGIAMQRGRKDFLVSSLKANDRCKFSEEELKGLSLQMLENLALLGSGADYSGAAGAPRLQAVQQRDNQAAPMPEAFPRKEAKDAGGGGKAA